MKWNDKQKCVECEESWAGRKGSWVQSGGRGRCTTNNSSRARESRRVASRRSKCRASHDLSQSGNGIALGAPWQPNIEYNLLYMLLLSLAAVVVVDVAAAAMLLLFFAIDVFVIGQWLGWFIFYGILSSIISGSSHVPWQRDLFLPLSLCVWQLATQSQLNLQQM